VEILLSRDGIPMKLAGKFHREERQGLDDLVGTHPCQVGRKPAALFEPPQGYAKLPPEAVAPLLGLRLKPAKQGRGGLDAARSGRFREVVKQGGVLDEDAVAHLSSGAQSSNRSNSSASSGFGVLPGCGQLVPHTLARRYFDISTRESGIGIGRRPILVAS